MQIAAGREGGDGGEEGRLRGMSKQREEDKGEALGRMQQELLKRAPTSANNCFEIYASNIFSTS